MTLYGSGRAAIADDHVTAERLEWTRRSKTAGDPEIVLRPRRGDARREPWITPPGWRRSQGAAALWGGGERLPDWAYLVDPPGVLRYLRRLAEPQRHHRCVAIAGLGRVGGAAATVLAAMPTGASGISELLIGDSHAANQDRWLAELGSITRWRAPGFLPTVAAATPKEMLERSDVVLFAASDAVPPLGTRGDVRHVQFEPNRALLRPYLEAAAKVEFAGLFMVVSDPVESLALATFYDSNRGPAHEFTGQGIAPERIGGLALAVMWGRALAFARRQGWVGVEPRGGAYGPHSSEVVVFDDVRAPDQGRSAELTQAAREGNFELRRMGFLPYVGPAVSSVALSLPPLLAGREALASVFLDGVYFGAPVVRPFGIFPVARRVSPAVKDALRSVHAQLFSHAETLAVLPGTLPTTRDC